MKKNDAFLAAILMLFFDLMKGVFSGSASSRKRKNLVTEQEVIEEIDRVFLQGDYYACDRSELLKESLRDKLQVCIEFSAENKDEDNLYQFAYLVREAIILKYLINREWLINEIAEALLGSASVDERLDAQNAVISLEVRTKKKNIKSFLESSLTPVFKKLFDSMGIRSYAYEEEAHDDFDSVTEQMIEDLYEAFTIWDWSAPYESDEIKESIDKKGVAIEQAVLMLKSDDAFMVSLARLCMKTPLDEDNLYDESLTANIQPIIKAFFMEKGIHYTDKELGFIWDELTGDRSFWVQVDNVIDRVDKPQVKSHAIKIYSENEEENEIDFAMKLVVDNPSFQGDVSIEVQGVDEEGFEVISLSIYGDIKINSETTLSERFDYYTRDEFYSVAEWKVSVI